MEEIYILILFCVLCCILLSVLLGIYIAFFDGDENKSCIDPDPVPDGYNITNVSGSKAMNSFNLTDITCADGYNGSAVATACSTSGTSYTLSGCSRVDGNDNCVATFTEAGDLTKYTYIDGSNFSNYDFNSLIDPGVTGINCGMNAQGIVSCSGRSAYQSGGMGDINCIWGEFSTGSINCNSNGIYELSGCTGPPSRTCADINADGITNDSFDCSHEINSRAANPATITCARDVCTAEECCTLPPPPRQILQHTETVPTEINEPIVTKYIERKVIDDDDEDSSNYRPTYRLSINISEEVKNVYAIYSTGDNPLILPEVNNAPIPNGNDIGYIGDDSIETVMAMGTAEAQSLALQMMKYSFITIGENGIEDLLNAGEVTWNNNNINNFILSLNEIKLNQSPPTRNILLAQITPENANDWTLTLNIQGKLNNGTVFDIKDITYSSQMPLDSSIPSPSPTYTTGFNTCSISGLAESRCLVDIEDWMGILAHFPGDLTSNCDCLAPAAAGAGACSDNNFLKYDLDNDCKVGASDLLYVLGNYNGVCTDGSQGCDSASDILVGDWDHLHPSTSNSASGRIDMTLSQGGTGIYDGENGNKVINWSLTNNILEVVGTDNSFTYSGPVEFTGLNSFTWERPAGEFTWKGGTQVFTRST
jgi:hypothetical protein